MVFMERFRFEVIHTRVLHWDYGQKPEDETQEKEVRLTWVDG